MYIGNFYAPTSIATGPGLSNAIDAVQTSFTINAKDPFGNDRRGDRTPDGLGSGTGFDDPFLVEFFGPDNYYDVTSSAIQTIYTTATSNINGTFTVSIDGKTTPDLPHDISASSMRDVLENLHVPAALEGFAICKRYTRFRMAYYLHFTFGELETF